MAQPPAGVLLETFGRWSKWDLLLSLPGKPGVWLAGSLVGTASSVLPCDKCGVVALGTRLCVAPDSIPTTSSSWVGHIDSLSLPFFVGKWGAPYIMGLLRRDYLK